jgi:hypothetical protein
MGLFFVFFRYIRLILFLRYLPRLLDHLFREKIPHRSIRRPLVWWLVRQVLRTM